MKLFHLLSVGMFAASMALVGCGDSGNGGTASTAPGGAGAKQKIMIGVVAKSVSNPVFQAAHQGAKDAAKELAAKYNADIEINIQTPTDESPEKQVEGIENLVRLGANGIAVSCSEAGKLTGAINAAVAKGVPVTAIVFAGVVASWFGKAIAISPGKITRNGNSIFGSAPISGVRRAALIEFAAMARCTTRKSVHQYPNDNTNPRPIANPNHSTPSRFVCALLIPTHECTKLGSSLAFSPDHPPTLFNPSQLSGKNPATIRKNCTTSL